MGGKSHIFTVVPSAARTSTVVFPLNGIPGDWDEIVGYLDVTAVSGTPTLDVSFENTVDDGTVFFSHTAFTQATTATTEKKIFTAPVGIDGQINCVIGGGTPSLTFTVRLECKRNG